MSKQRKYRCKCKATGKVGDTLTFYKTDDGYFESKEIYEKWKKAKELEKQENDIRKEIIEYIAVVYLNYLKGGVYPSYIAKRLKEFKPYGYEIVKKTIAENEKSIRWGLAYNEFKDNSHRINYIMAIITNNINDVYQKHERKKKLENKIANEKTTLTTQMIVDDLNHKDESKIHNTNKNLKQFLVEGDDY